MCPVLFRPHVVLYCIILAGVYPDGCAIALCLCFGVGGLMDGWMVAIVWFSVFCARPGIGSQVDPCGVSISFVVHRVG